MEFASFVSTVFGVNAAMLSNQKDIEAKTERFIFSHLLLCFCVDEWPNGVEKTVLLKIHVFVWTLNSVN